MVVKDQPAPVLGENRCMSKTREVGGVKRKARMVTEVRGRRAWRRRREVWRPISARVAHGPHGRNKVRAVCGTQVNFPCGSVERASPELYSRMHAEPAFGMC